VAVRRLPDEPLRSFRLGSLLVGGCRRESHVVVSVPVAPAELPVASGGATEEFLRCRLKPGAPVDENSRIRHIWILHSISACN
jgi:hypothetical protein